MNRGCKVLKHTIIVILETHSWQQRGEMKKSQSDNFFFFFSTFISSKKKTKKTNKVSLYQWVVFEVDQNGYREHRKQSLYILR